jgi:hypothetical protein
MNGQEEVRVASACRNQTNGQEELAITARLNKWLSKKGKGGKKGRKQKRVPPKDLLLQAAVVNHVEAGRCSTLGLT